MKLTKNQKQFVEDARKAGLEVDFTYSGKFMYGKCCPSVVVESYHQLETSAVVWMDNLGLRFVLYAME